MCVVSMISDHYKDKWDKFPWEIYSPPTRIDDWAIRELAGKTEAVETASKEELEQLRKEVAEMKELLRKAIDYDKRTNQPHCQQEDKIAFLKKVAESVGVSLEDVFK